MPSRYLDKLHVMMTDATCYESYSGYLTSVKLLWESVVTVSLVSF
ncbi:MULTISPECIES: hypothetical protein [unclassified Butyricimonas]|nr:MULTISPECIES: hypothetical protein [unclassified Butyricimonas]